MDFLTRSKWKVHLKHIVTTGPFSSSARRILLVGHNSKGSGEILDKVLRTFQDCEVMVAVTGGVFYRRNLLQSLLKLFAQASWGFVILRALDFLRLEPARLANVCKRSGIIYFHTKDINSTASIARVREFNPDILASTFTMHILGEEIIALSNLKTIGVHPSILPSYRGLEVFFWMMANGETEGGTSCYELVPRVDAGKVLLQEAWVINQPDTVHAVYDRLTESCARVLCAVIERTLSGNGVEFSQTMGITESYFPMPTRAAMKNFRSRGHRWM